MAVAATRWAWTRRQRGATKGMSAQSIVHSAVAHLAQFTTAASRRPWAVLWIPVPIAWQIAARSAGVNRAEEALAVLLSVPELIGILCGVGMIGWCRDDWVATVERRESRGPTPRETTTATVDVPLVRAYRAVVLWWVVADQRLRPLGRSGKHRGRYPGEHQAARGITPSLLEKIDMLCMRCRASHAVG